MPRFEPAINQFIAPEDQCVMTAAPFKPTRSHQRKKSISALERLVVFTEATHRVKRRLRNVIAGAVGASTSRPKRKSRDVMHVDYVWNGWFEPGSFTVDPASESVPGPRQPTLPNFVPTINRYSVNMDGQSISDVSMDFGESDDEGASTPRANTPEPVGPVAAPAEELKSKKVLEDEDEDEEDQHEGENEAGDDHEHDEDHEEEEEEEPPAKVKPKKSEVEIFLESRPDEDAASMVLSPMDEDPIESACTPKAASPVALPSQACPKKSKRRSIPVIEDADDKTPPLTTRTPSTESTPPKTPKLTLQTNFALTPVKGNAHFLTGMIDVFTTSPVGLGLDLEAEIHMFKGLDLMDVIPSSAISQDGDAPTYAIERGVVGSRRSGLKNGDGALQRPALMPAAKLIEKKPSRKVVVVPLVPSGSFTNDPTFDQSSRRGSRASETEIIACSPRGAAILAGKKGSLKGIEPARGVISPTTLRKKIDSLPLEQDDSIPAWGVWTLQTSIPFFHQNNSEYSALPIQTMWNAGDPQ